VKNIEIEDGKIAKAAINEIDDIFDKIKQLTGLNFIQILFLLDLVIYKLNTINF